MNHWEPQKANILWRIWIGKQACRLTQVSLSEALICRGAASISVCCLEASKFLCMERLFLLTSPLLARTVGPLWLLVGGEQA